MPEIGNQDSDTGASLPERIKDLRRQRHWTLEELSAASGVSRSMLSEIERGRANPTLAVVMRIAEAFSLTLDQLVMAGGGKRGIEVVRGTDDAFLYRADPDCQIRTLSPLHLEKDIEYYQIRLGPKAELKSSPHFRDTREIVTVVSGELEIEAGQHREKLRPGDSGCYPADQPHCLRNLSGEEMLLYLIVTYRV